MTIKKEIDFKEVYLSMPDFIDNEAFESLLELFGIERAPENDYQSIKITVTKIEIY